MIYAMRRYILPEIKEMLGEWDFKCHIVVKNQANLHKVINEIKFRFRDIIKTYDTLVMHKEHLFNPFPEVLSEKNI